MKSEMNESFSGVNTGYISNGPNRDPRFNRIYLTHANKGCKVTLVLGTISHWEASDKLQCQVVYTIGGAVPVKESVDEIEQQFKKATEP